MLNAKHTKNEQTNFDNFCHKAKLERCGQFLNYLLLLIDFHGQITGNDNLNKFLAEFMQNNQEM